MGPGCSRTTCPSRAFVARSGMAEDRHQTRVDEARKDLERVAEQGEIVGTSSMARAASRARGHFAGADAAGEGLEHDPVEVWGRRVGRLLGLAFFLFLVWWLATTYL